VRPEELAEDPERIAIRETLASGKAVYDVRTALGLTVAELANRANMSDDEVECMKVGGTESTVALPRRLAAALNAEVRLTAGMTSAPSGLIPTLPSRSLPSGAWAQRAKVAEPYGTYVARRSRLSPPKPSKPPMEQG
jgi:hypothetical protein